MKGVWSHMEPLEGSSDFHISSPQALELAGPGEAANCWKQKRIADAKTARRRWLFLVVCTRGAFIDVVL